VHTRVILRKLHANRRFWIGIANQHRAVATQQGNRLFRAAPGGLIKIDQIFDVHDREDQPKKSAVRAIDAAYDKQAQFAGAAIF
jgi:hypothetical protein